MCAKKITYRPSPTALLNPRCDPSFKAMFTQETEESNAALQDFISVLIGREVRKIALVPNEPPVDSLNEMQMTFDVSVTFDDGERADIEMQSRSQNYDYAARAEIQAARNELHYVGKFKGGHNYMGKILKRCQDALLDGTEPTINYDLLREKKIYLFGELLSFAG